jgi:hypothetical protein
MVSVPVYTNVFVRKITDSTSLDNKYIVFRKNILLHLQLADEKAGVDSAKKTFKKYFFPIYRKSRAQSNPVFPSASCKYNAMFSQPCRDVYRLKILYSFVHTSFFAQ